MSALHPKADMCAATIDVRYGPRADIYSATSDVRQGPHAAPSSSQALQRLCKRCTSPTKRASKGEVRVRGIFKSTTARMTTGLGHRQHATPTPKPADTRLKIVASLDPSWMDNRCTLHRARLRRGAPEKRDASSHDPRRQAILSVVARAVRMILNRFGHDQKTHKNRLQRGYP
jgi:hypothetical protein